MICDMSYGILMLLPFTVGFIAGCFFMLGAVVFLVRVGLWAMSQK